MKTSKIVSRFPLAVALALLASISAIDSMLASPPIIPGEMPSVLQGDAVPSDLRGAAIDHFKLGRQDFFATNFDNAIKEFTAAIQAEPNPSAYVARAFARRWGRGDTKGAIADYSEAVKLKPDLAEAYFWRGEAIRDSSSYGSEGYRRALADFSKALECKPDYIEAYRRRSWVEEGLKDPKAAENDLSKVVQLAPDKAKSYLERATLRVKTGNNKGALDDYAEAIKISTTPLPEAYSARADLRSKLKDPKGAVEDYTKALELSKDNSNLVELRAYAYEARAKIRDAQGDKRGAEKDLADAKEMRMHSPPCP